MGTTNRYCTECGHRLNYYPRLSNPKAPNEHRVLVYSCPSCTVDEERPMMISIKTTNDEDPIKAVEVEIIKYRQKGV